MGGRPQKREKASGRKEWELGSTWNLKWTHVGIGVRCPPFYVGTGLRWYGFTLFTLGRCPRFTLVQVLRGDVGTGLRLKRGTGLR